MRVATILELICCFLSCSARASAIPAEISGARDSPVTMTSEEVLGVMKHGILRESGYLYSKIQGLQKGGSLGRLTRARSSGKRADLLGAGSFNAAMSSPTNKRRVGYPSSGKPSWRVGYFPEVLVFFCLGDWKRSLLGCWCVSRNGEGDCAGCGEHW